jgi:hypothetical protein
MAGRLKGGSRSPGSSFSGAGRLCGKRGLAGPCTRRARQRVQKIKAAIPDAAVTLTVRHGYVDWDRSGNAADVSRNSIDVEKKVGVITVKRSYTSPAGDY